MVVYRPLHSSLMCCNHWKLIRRKWKQFQSRFSFMIVLQNQFIQMTTMMVHLAHLFYNWNYERYCCIDYIDWHMMFWFRYLKYLIIHLDISASKEWQYCSKFNFSSNTVALLCFNWYWHTSLKNQIKIIHCFSLLYFNRRSRHFRDKILTAMRFYLQKLLYLYSLLTV